MKEFDVAIVGAGPAGCSAAKVAAESGVDVLLIERKREIGLPCHCAGAVTRRIEKLVELDDDFVAARISRFNWYTSTGEEVSFDGKQLLGYILRREVLDKKLAMLAVRAGADLMINANVTDVSGKTVSVKHMDKRTQVKAHIIIGADGIGSKVAKWTGIEAPKEIVSCVQFKVVNASLEEDTSDFYWGGNWAPGGFAWIFPREDGQALVGVGVRRASKPAYHYLMNLIKNHPIASFKLKESSIIGISGGSVPLETTRKTVVDNVLIVGDAAGQVNPVNGAGIEYAIICGKMAGEIAARAIHSNNLEKTLKFEDMWRRNLGREFKACLTARRILDKMSDEQLDMFISSLKGENVYELMTSFDTKRMFMLAVKKAPALFKLVRSFIRIGGK